MSDERTRQRLELRITKSGDIEESIFTIQDGRIVHHLGGDLAEFTDEWLAWARDQGWIVEFRDVVTTRTPWRPNQRIW